MRIDTGDSDDAHEAMCRRCGISCHFAIQVNSLPVVIDDLHCRFLARSSGGTYRCMVYAERFERAPWCRTVGEALEDGLLAQDCPYAVGRKGYRGKVRLDRRLLVHVEPAVRAEILRRGVPAGASKEGVLRFLARTGGGDWRLRADPEQHRILIEPAEPRE